MSLFSTANRSSRLATSSRARASQPPNVALMRGSIRGSSASFEDISCAPFGLSESCDEQRVYSIAANRYPHHHCGILRVKLAAVGAPIAAVHFRKDQLLSPKTAHALAQMILAAQRALIAAEDSSAQH